MRLPRPPFMRVLAGICVLLLASACALLSHDGGGSVMPSAGEVSVPVSGSAVAGPTCPVVTEPPQPGCAARPVEGAVILVLAADGSQVKRIVAGADGSFAVRLPAGRYRLVPQRVEGLMGTAPEQTLEVQRGSAVSDVVITYDTGIR